MNPVTTENQGTLPDCKPVISGKVQLHPEPQTPKSDFYLQICVLFALLHPVHCHTEAMCKSMDCLLVINKKEQSPRTETNFPIQFLAQVIHQINRTISI